MAIQLEKLSYTYQAATPLAQQALKDVSFTIKDQSFTAIVGHTGSGKSTLLQHLNGLLKPTSGRLTVNGQVITPATKNKELAKLRQEVGFVFQFPEAQLVNLDESVLERSPFELSGGQMRRVAIAGILAMSPKVLVLDEPTAGLDPSGRAEMMALFKRLHEKEKLTIILVTHQMNDVANFADQVLVMESGRLLADKTPAELFSDPGWLKKHHLNLPQTTAFAQRLVERGMEFAQLPLTEHELAKVLATKIKEAEGENG